MKRIVILSALLVASCNQPVQPSANDAEIVNTDEPAPTPTPHLADAAPLPAGGMREWLVGIWSFEKDCASDFAVHYNPDGSVENSGDSGRWTLDGDKITETITERFEMGGDAPQKVEPAEVRSYTVSRVDQNHGVVTSPFNGRKVPILRC